MMSNDEDGLVIICCYVDDALNVGQQAAINKAKQEIDSVFTTKKFPEVTEYVGVTIRENKQQGTIHLSQSDVIARMESANRDRQDQVESWADQWRVPTIVDRLPLVIQLYRDWIRTTYARDWDVAQNLGRPAPALDNPADQARHRLSLEDYN